MPAGAPAEIKSLVSLLSGKGRLALLPGVAEAYRQLLTETAEVLYITVSSAFPLDEEQYGRIGKIYTGRYGAKSHELIKKTDPYLLGGVRVQIGDKVADGTLRMKLNKLKEHMI
jgi:F-type H+-transporting ATPase subunit delta